MSGLSIVIPIFNEKNNLVKLSHLIYKFVKIKNFELIFVDDNSVMEHLMFYENKKI